MKKSSTTKKTTKKSSRTTDRAALSPEPEVKLSHCPESCAFIEDLTRKCMQTGDDDERHIALLELLTYIEEDPSWVMWARTTVISESLDLRDRAANVLVALAQQQRSDDAKGASA